MHRVIRIHRVLSVLGALCTLLPYSLCVSAQSISNGGLSGRPVRLIVPFAAGGPTDVMARALAEVLVTRLNEPVVVENRAGAGGNIAAAHVASAAADGHTLLVAGQAILAINQALYTSLPYDPARDFTWIGMLGSIPNVLVAHPEAVPATSMAEFLALARTRTLSYGSNGLGSLSHLTTEAMALTAGVHFIHVPYQGAAPQRADLLSGRIGFTLVGSSTAVPLVRSGHLRALAISTAKRSAALPDIPTLVESGFPMLDAPVWFAALAPVATPAPIVSALRNAFALAIAEPSYAAELNKQMGDVVSVTPEAAVHLLARERKVWADTVRATGATAQ